VVEPDDQRHRFETGHARDHLRTPLGMEADQLALLRVEPARLVQHARGHAQLADVVHQRGQLHLHDVRSAEVQPDRHLARSCRDLQRVPIRGAVGLSQRLHQCPDLRLGVAKAELVAGVVAERRADQARHFIEQFALASLRAVVVVRPAHTERPAFLGPHKNGGRGNAAERGPATPARHAPPDQIRVGAGSGHRRQRSARTGSAHQDPRLLEPEDCPSVLGETIENHTGIAESLRGGHAHAADGGAFAASAIPKPVAPRGHGEQRKDEEVDEDAESHPPCEYVKDDHGCARPPRRRHRPGVARELPLLADRGQAGTACCTSPVEVRARDVRARDRIRYRGSAFCTALRADSVVTRPRAVPS
jgi:hypothetical protein